MSSCSVSSAAIAVLLSAGTSLGGPVKYNSPNWIHQFGTPGFDSATSIAAVEFGDFYVTGVTAGTLAGTSAGSDDIFLAKYNAAGDQLWLSQYGSPNFDYAASVAPDDAGGVFVAGDTKGQLGSAIIGYHDAFLTRFDQGGNELWTRQFGTPLWDVAHAAAADGTGGAMVVGVTAGDMGGQPAGKIDAFVASFDDAGTMRWIQQFGTPGIDTALAVASDGNGGAIVAGVTTGDLGGTSAGTHDVFVTRYASTGEQVWMRQIGSELSDRVFDIAADGNGGAIAVGLTHGTLGGQSEGRSDAFAVHFDSDGNQTWLKQLGTSGSDAATAVASDGNGGALITGYTYADMGGPYAGGGDTFILHLDANGDQLSIRQFGSDGRDEPLAIANSIGGGATIVGYTSGDLGGTNAGSKDIFIGNFVSEPCFADCDQSTGQGVLDVFDFLCFQDSFVNGDSYACDCDTTTDLRVCDVFDFLCFQSSFVQGCP